MYKKIKNNIKIIKKNKVAYVLKFSDIEKKLIITWDELINSKLELDSNWCIYDSNKFIVKEELLNVIYKDLEYILCERISVVRILNSTEFDGDRKVKFIYFEL